jgi:hypothetical protein
MSCRRFLLTIPLAIGLCALDSPAKDKRKGKAERAHANNSKSDGNNNGWKRATEGHRPQDLNGDGVITRNEWPGNDVSFRELDRDGDGALTRKDRGPGAEGTGTKMYDRAVNDNQKSKKGKGK